MDKVRVVLKDKTGKVIRELYYPEKNAKKLVSFNSGWVIEKKKKLKPNNSETSE